MSEIHSSSDRKRARFWNQLLDLIGVRVTTDEDDVAPPTISDVRKRWAGTSFPEQYQVVWNRFLSEPEAAKP
jgi:hypothetical protein